MLRDLAGSVQALAVIAGGSINAGKRYTAVRSEEPATFRWPNQLFAAVSTASLFAHVLLRMLMSDKA